MGKKALIVATVAGFVASFGYNDILLLKSMGYEVHCAFKLTEGGNIDKKKIIYENTIVHEIDFARYPISKTNVAAYKELMNLMKQERFDLVHCHTPVAGVLGRIVAHKCQVPNIIYTAHGFHFYTGASIKNWLMYYPVEWLCSFWTDTLITINTEDYQRAKRNFHAKKTEYIPGVGVDTKKFGLPYDSVKIRNEFGIEGFMLLSVGELNENKNHASVIRAVAGLPLTYVIVGKGDLQDQLQDLAADVGANVILTGFRSDVTDFYAAADVYILPSIREGLNVSLMEAMASSLPCLCGRIRGNTDLIENSEYLFEPTNVEEIRGTIQKIMTSNRDTIGTTNSEKIKSFDKELVQTRLGEIYQGCLS